MSLRYLKVKKKPRTFLRLFGISVSEFDIILSKELPEFWVVTRALGVRTIIV